MVNKQCNITCTLKLLHTEIFLTLDLSNDSTTCLYQNGQFNNAQQA